MAGADTSEAIQITALDGGRLVDDITDKVSFSFKQPVIYQMQRRQHGRLLFRVHFFGNIHGEDIGIGHEFLGKGPQTIWLGLDNLSNDIAIRILDFKRVITADTTNAADRIGSDGCNFIVVTVHDLKGGRQSTSTGGFHNMRHFLTFTRTLVYGHFLATTFMEGTALTTFAAAVNVDHFFSFVVHVKLQLVIGLAATTARTATVFRRLDDAKFQTTIVRVGIVLVGNFTQGAQGTHSNGVGRGIGQGFNRFKLLLNDQLFRKIHRQKGQQRGSIKTR